LPDLLDLRSRALLIVNTAKPAHLPAQEEESGAKLKEMMTLFIKCVELAQEIYDTFSTLKRLGHFDFQSFKQDVDFKYSV
jgi:hypothetical protein